MNTRKEDSGYIKVIHMVPLRAGGITSMVLNIAEEISGSEVLFDYLTFRDQEEFNEKKALRYGGKKLVVPKDKYGNPLLRAVYKFIKTILVLKKEEADIIHINASFPYDIFVGISAKMAGIPYVIFHSHNSNMSSSNRLKKFLMPLCKVFIPYVSDCNLACSESAANFMFPDKILKEHNYTILKNGIYSSKFLYNADIREQSRAKWSLKRNYVIGHVGRFTEQKNHRFLLEVFREIYRKEKTAVLMLIGTGPLEEKIKALAEKMSLSHRILFLGVTDQVPQLMQAMDCFVLPSLYEGLPFAAVEAQAAGLPVFLSDQITREAAVTETVQYLSLKVPPQKWADTILYFKDHPADRTQAQKQIKESGFDISMTARQLLSIYRGLKG